MKTIRMMLLALVAVVSHGAGAHSDEAELAYFLEWNPDEYGVRPGSPNTWGSRISAVAPRPGATLSVRTEQSASGEVAYITAVVDESYAGRNLVLNKRAPSLKHTSVQERVGAIWVEQVPARGAIKGLRFSGEGGAWGMHECVEYIFSLYTRTFSEDYGRTGNYLHGHLHYTRPSHPEPCRPLQWDKAAFVPSIPPGREGSQGGSLRIMNPGAEVVGVRVTARNEAGESQHVEESLKRIPAGGQIRIDVIDEEEDSGVGWWSVLVEAQRGRTVHVTATVRSGEGLLTLPVVVPKSACP